MSNTDETGTRASLLQRAANPLDTEAQESFCKRYGPLIDRYCRRWQLQDADRQDVTQDILLKLLRKLPTFKYDPSKGFRGLVWVMVRNAIADLHARIRTRPGIRGSADSGVREQLAQIPAPNDPSVAALANELSAQLETDHNSDALHAPGSGDSTSGQPEYVRDPQVKRACDTVKARVKSHTWSAFWLTTFEGKPVQDVAGQLGMTHGNVLVAKHRVTKMMRTELSKPTGSAPRDANNAGGI